ncbi:MAG: cellulase family glycosylhydrolase [Ruminococcus sp.]|uniref:cellulase family glycosylhydrolase n=1 Tax=Ruminococcus sp. TaxID=41978 RepID=UPI0025DA9525|nr:cellulase family glycosylhydrolase [Ruminococcus sp.]MCR5600366.1 cellulase family glycosylhydrolase [Ruminococcus sp.]
MNSFFKKGCSAALAAVTLVSSAMGNTIFTTSAVTVSIQQFSGESSGSTYSIPSGAISSDISVTDIGGLSVPLLASNKAAASKYSIPELNIPARSVPETEGIKFVKDMRLGWNLGNTMDAIDDTGWVGSEMGIETCWNGGYKTTKKMIDTVKAAGFRTVRIPVSWHNHVDANYQITKQWMDRVQEIVDYAIDDGMYVILNVHHDNDAKYMYPDTAHYAQSKKYMTTVWSQIAERFKEYDNKLIFETMNEPRLIGHQNEWWINPSNPDCIDAIKTINQLNQDCLDTIRKSGGNNGTRYVSVPGYDCSVDGATNENFRIPTDSVQNRLIVAVHAYLPYGFALAEESDSQSVRNFNIKTDTGEINQAFDKVYQKYTSKGIPVYVGEYGAREKGSNVQDRVDCAAYFTAYASSVGVTCCWWDDISFMLLDRSNCTWKRPEIVAAINKYARGTAESTIVTSVTNPSEIVTTTTSSNITESDKIYGVETAGGMVSFGTSIGETAFVDVQFKGNTNFMNGCLGFSPQLNGKSYWVSYVWEAKKSGTITLDMNKPKQVMDVSQEPAEAVTDADVKKQLIEKIKKEQSALLQAWYASDKTGKEITPPASGAESIKAFIISSNGSKQTTTTTSTTSTTSTTTVATTSVAVAKADKYGDANCDKGVDMADVVIIMQSLANPNKYGINGSEEHHITDQGLANADVQGNNGVSTEDALAIQLYLLGKYKALPVD